MNMNRSDMKYHMKELVLNSPHNAPLADMDKYFEVQCKHIDHLSAQTDDLTERNNALDNRIGELVDRNNDLIDRNEDLGQVNDSLEYKISRVKEDVQRLLAWI